MSHSSGLLGFPVGEHRRGDVRRRPAPACRRSRRSPRRRGWHPRRAPRPGTRPDTDDPGRPRRRGGRCPTRRPVNTMNPTTALTSSLRQAAVLKSGSSSTVTPAPRNNSASVAAASVSGSTSRGSVAHPHPAVWLDLRRDPHGGRHDRRRRAEPSHPFHLFDAVLQRAHHRVLVAQPRQPGAGLLVLGVLDGERTPRRPDRRPRRDRCARVPAARSDRGRRAGPRSIRARCARTAGRGDRRRADMRRRSRRWRRVR